MAGEEDWLKNLIWNDVQLNRLWYINVDWMINGVKGENIGRLVMWSLHIILHIDHQLSLYWEGNIITDKFTVLKRKWRTIFRLKAELKMLDSRHGLLCATWKFYHMFCLIFLQFFVPILTCANQPKWHFMFFFSKVQWSKKITT